MKKKWPIGATHLPPAQIPSQAFSQVRVRKGLGEQSASIGVREGGVVYKGRANVRGGSQKGVQSRGILPGPEPLGAHSCQLAAPSGSTPGCPEIGLRLTRHPPQEASASSLSGFPHLPGFRLSPFCLLPPRQNSIQNSVGREGCPGKTAGWLRSAPFRPAARVLLHPRHRGTSGGRAVLGCLWAHRARWEAMGPGYKPTRARESQLLGRRCALQLHTRVS